MKLILGTAQFGLNYGISNTKGQIPKDEVEAILDLAFSYGIDSLDTAISYGQSEKILGSIGINHWKIITKLPAIPPNCTDVIHWVFSEIEASLKRLRIDKLYGLLLHHSDDLHGHQGAALYQALQYIKAQGLSQKIGISIYSPQEAMHWIDDKPFDLIQAPLNLLDRRLITSDLARKLKMQGVEIHVRSLFLQGLLLMPSDKRPKKFMRWCHLWQQWDDWIKEQGISKLQTCLAYASSQAQIDKMVLGIDSIEHLKEIIAAYRYPIKKIPTWLETYDEALINPTRWSTL